MQYTSVLRKKATKQSTWPTRSTKTTSTTSQNSLKIKLLFKYVQVCSSTVSSLDPHQVPINLHVFSSNNHVCWLLASPKPTSPQHPEIPCHQQVQRQGTHCGTSPVKFPQSSNGGVLKIGVPQIHGDFRSFLSVLDQT